MTARPSGGLSSRRRLKRRRLRSTDYKVNKGRVAVVAIVLLSVMSGLVFRLVDIQATPDERLSERVFIPVSVVTVHGPRGAVLDRNGRTIALSLPAATIVADPRIVDDPEATAAVLSDELAIPVNQILPKLQGDGAFSYLARQIDLEAGERISSLGLVGIDVIDEPRREHPNGDCSALAAIGRVNIDHVGMSGLEEAHDERLSGTAGRIVKEIGADGTTIPGGRKQVAEAKAGSDIVVTLDRNIQYQAEQLLIDAVSSALASSGVALVSLPGTGEIVAMANVTRSDTGIVGCTRHNLAATWSYEPGSVFKPVTVAAALSRGVVAEETILTVPASVTIAGHPFEEPRHDELEWTPTEILKVSSNVGAIKLAQAVREEDMLATIKKFGFGERTALDFKGESGGILLPLKDWNQLTLPTIAIGQALAVTPLQLLQAYNSIANGGVLVPLRLIAEDSGFEPESASERVRVLDTSTAAALRRMLATVVQQGTGRRAALAGFTMAGKTGTAWQPCDVGYKCMNEQNEFVGGRHHTATFAGIVSNDEGPVLVVVVVIDRPKSLNVSGGFLSAPVVREVAEYALRQLRIPAMSDAAPNDRRQAEPAPEPEPAPPADGDAAGTTA